MTQFALTVEGMTCGGCVRSIENALKRLDANAKVAVDLDSGRVEVETAMEKQAVVSGIEDAGFAVVAG